MNFLLRLNLNDDEDNNAQAIIDYLNYVYSSCVMKEEKNFSVPLNEVTGLNSLLSLVFNEPLNDLRDHLLINITNIGLVRLYKINALTCDKILADEIRNQFCLFLKPWFFFYNIVKNLSSICSNDEFNFQSSHANYPWVAAYGKTLETPEWQYLIQSTKITSVTSCLFSVNLNFFFYV